MFIPFDNFVGMRTIFLDDLVNGLGDGKWKVKVKIAKIQSEGVRFF